METGAANVSGDKPNTNNNGNAMTAIHSSDVTNFAVSRNNLVDDVVQKFVQNGNHAPASSVTAPSDVPTPGKRKGSDSHVVEVEASAKKLKHYHHGDETSHKSVESKTDQHRNDNGSQQQKSIDSEKTLPMKVAQHSSSSIQESKPLSGSTLEQKQAAIEEKPAVKHAPKEIVSQFVKLPSLPARPTALVVLSMNETKELGRYFELGKEDWPDDWIGCLALLSDRDIPNPDAINGNNDRRKKSLLLWAERGKVSLKLVANVLRRVYHLSGIPSQAKKILANADTTSIESLRQAVRRVSYDPAVLRQDGWTTSPAPVPVGASGGAFRIGESVIWQNFVGVVVAYVHDEDLGDLWKGMWTDEFDTFDLEAEELDEARKRFDRKKLKMASAEKGQKKKDAETPTNDASRRSGRYAGADYTVNGIEHGIVMATSYSKGSRPGVFWPARVIHVSEMKQYRQQNKRVNKQKVDVIFLAPYWNGQNISPNSRRTESYSNSVARHGQSIFSSGPLFEIESIDASEDSIHEFRNNSDSGLDMDELRTSFKFSGLPKAAFSRFVHSNRLGLALKTFSENVLRSTVATDLDKTTASLFEAHPLAGQTASFPPALLSLPFEFMLSKLPSPEYDPANKAFSDSNSSEPALQLSVMLDSMKPPVCWGQDNQNDSSHHFAASPESTQYSRPLFASPPTSLKFDADGKCEPVSVDSFLHGLPSLSKLLSNDNSSMATLLAQNLEQLLSRIPQDKDECKQLPRDDKRDRLQGLVKLWIVVKTHGEELISSCKDDGSHSCLRDWRRACERIYKFMTTAFTDDGFGNGASWVLTDSVCNLHLTSNQCFERAVRLPAALKAAKMAGAGKSTRLQLATSVEQKYLDMAEKEVIIRAHSKSYIVRMKKRCLAVEPGKIVALTEDSEGNGGEDTKGSRGSWNAAIAGVGAAVKAVDMITNGECVNVFCSTRPPGHHAGRELHPLKAVSNGFCLLNNAACAALYATAPVSEGGPGLRRVCVVDIDVHHGNGTQDILCSTYDPRFLYVSLHAGGPDVNGIDPEDDSEQLGHHLGRSPKKGIFPGRCGDSSPHPGVLNIPMGPKVTSHALGQVLLAKVTPAVEKFSPELIIVSAGFDAHKNDPLNLGGLSAEDFGTLTEVICKLAHQSCSGRVLSILEGGYGVPCCRPQNNLFDPQKAMEDLAMKEAKKAAAATTPPVPDVANIVSPPASQSVAPTSQQSISIELPSSGQSESISIELTSSGQSAPLTSSASGPPTSLASPASGQPTALVLPGSGQSAPLTSSASGPPTALASSVSGQPPAFGRPAVSDQPKSLESSPVVSGPPNGLPPSPAAKTIPPILSAPEARYNSVPVILPQAQPSSHDNTTAVPTGQSPAASTVVPPTSTTASTPPVVLPVSSPSLKNDANRKKLDVLDLGEEIPEDMKDDMSYMFQKKLDKCHVEGFMQCVEEHVRALAKCNRRS